MNTIVAKEKPDLLFNNPLKQKVYQFLKNNPGKNFEMFQVLTGDGAVSRQHFNEVEQAIRAREDREKSRVALKEVNALFIQGSPFDKPKAYSSPSDNPEPKESTLRKPEKKKMNDRANQFIKENPDCTYDELVKSLGFADLSKPHFF